MKYRFGIVDGLIECLHFKEPAQELFLCFRTGLLFGGRTCPQYEQQPFPDALLERTYSEK